MGLRPVFGNHRAASGPGTDVAHGDDANQGGVPEIGVIKASIPVTPTQQFYSYSWRVGDYYGGTAILGGGYKILVKIVTPAKSRSSDLSDSAFVIGAVPTIDYFAINDGLAVTNQRKVNLNYRITGFPSPGGFRVRCTPKPGTVKDAPLAAGTWPTSALPGRAGVTIRSRLLAHEQFRKVTDPIQSGTSFHLHLRKILP